MNTREGLLELEQDRWATLTHLLEQVPRSRTDETSLNPEGWSVRDLVWHLACWNDVVATQLRLMHAGASDEGWDWNTEENNARFLETGRSLTFPQAMSALQTSRTEAIRAMSQLADVPPRALELFSEPAFQHVDDHVPELRHFLATDAPA